MLTGSNTYTGGTTITGGTLLANNTIGNLSFTDSVLIFQTEIDGGSILAGNLLGVLGSVWLCDGNDIVVKLTFAAEAEAVRELGMLAAVALADLGYIAWRRHQPAWSEGYRAMDTSSPVRPSRLKRRRGLTGRLRLRPSPLQSLVPIMIKTGAGGGMRHVAQDQHA